MTVHTEQTSAVIVAAELAHWLHGIDLTDATDDVLKALTRAGRLLPNGGVARVQWAILSTPTEDSVMVHFVDGEAEADAQLAEDPRPGARKASRTVIRWPEAQGPLYIGPWDTAAHTGAPAQELPVSHEVWRVTAIAPKGHYRSGQRLIVGTPTRQRADAESLYRSPGAGWTDPILEHRFVRDSPWEPVRVDT